MPQALELRGQKFGRLHVIAHIKTIGIGRRKKRIWLCKCECGNTTEVSTTKLRSGNTRSCGCLHREIITNLNRKEKLPGYLIPQIDTKYIRKQFEKEGYQLLSPEYKNAFQKLNYICPKGHNHNITWRAWKQGQRCFHCNILKKRHTIEFIRSKFEKEEYQLLTTKYKNAFQKLEYICPKGHKHHITWVSWYNGNRCYFCSNHIKPTIEQIRKEFEEEGYQLLTDNYIRGAQKLKYICPKGHKHAITWNDWHHSKARCYYCNESKGEKRVAKFLDSHNINYSSQKMYNDCRNPKTGRKLKFDFYLNDLDILIEYDGEYHFIKTRHPGDKLKETQYRDGIKNRYVKEKNIRLIRIPYMDFDRIEEILGKKLGVKSGMSLAYP